MSDSKIQIKVGIVEFVGEGNQEWLTAQLDKILEKVPELLKIEMNPGRNNGKGHPADQDSNGINVHSPLSLSMINIAAKLKAKSGQDVATAAAAFLKLVQRKATFSREELLKNMKDATGYYRSTFNSNLTNILIGLVKNNTLTQTAENSYSLQVDKETQLNGILSK